MIVTCHPTDVNRLACKCRETARAPRAPHSQSRTQPASRDQPASDSPALPVSVSTRTPSQ
ncbi:hypothetical protein T492DRAFT_996057 [Pavlovales sp. CCMP2436]|nr:hypothetical protein T492DRAFT_996057 [Pavlovales sp. CCMP2436]